MPTLDFKGKQHIYAHHLTVPYRTIEADESRSYNPSNTNDNLIIHGDNLHGLKALLPRYANRVKCIYIDPPYNTGNEGWCYNDSVNSPLMQQWLVENAPVDNEDLERHDKWLCMMWPRLHLLQELLAEDGIIFISIDDNEHHHLRMLMDEIFGAENFIGTFLWKKKGTSTNVRGTSVSATADYQLCYRKSIMGFITPRVTPKETRQYPNQDEQGKYRTSIIEKRNDGTYARQTMRFQILGQYPREGRRWQIGQKTARELEAMNRFIIDNGIVKKKIYDFEDKDTTSAHPTYLPDSCGSSDSANKTLSSILGDSGFENPKPVELIAHLLTLSSGPNDIVLDSFAGSGTTAHAVLALNKKDGGNRKFILIECEDYADTITAERVRRVINGVPNIDDASLREGLGGSFTYSTLGKPIEMEGMLTGEALPSYESLAAHLLCIASGVSVGANVLDPKNRNGLFHSSGGIDYYLFYKPDLEYLESPEAMLNLERAERIRDANHQNGVKAIVYAPGKYISQRELTGMGITFCQLPHALHKR